ncbi:hypothetical protein ACN47A_08685 [Myxococcus fulvus]
MAQELAGAPQFHPLKQWVRLTKLRWLVERHHQEPKAEVGLDHYAVAHGFLALRRALFPWSRVH